MKTTLTPEHQKKINSWVDAVLNSRRFKNTRVYNNIGKQVKLSTGYGGAYQFEGVVVAATFNSAFGFQYLISDDNDLVWVSDLK